MAYSCDGVTKRGRMCKRAATMHYVLPSGACTRHYCTPHGRGAGVMKMLLPFVWEYDHTEHYREGSR